MDKTIALVLGAGASAWLEFPLGSTLRSRILDLVDHERFSFAVNSGLYSFGEHELKIFINEFKKSQMNSIDSFLARRREYTEIGKAAIAAILLEAESQNDLFSHESKDNWYRYLLNRLSSETWDELDFMRDQLTGLPHLTPAQTANHCCIAILIALANMCNAFAATLSLH